MCRVGNCPKTRQGNCNGMCRAHFQESEERAERERQEVELKLAVLADQLELQAVGRQTSARNRSIV